MPVSDQKKVQTMVNIAADQIIIVRSAIDTLKTIRTAFNNHNPNTTGTPLAGKKTALSLSIDTLDLEARLAIWSDMISSKVETHQGKALD
jgi:hypothetical protein